MNPAPVYGNKAKTEWLAGGQANRFEKFSLVPM